MTATRIVAVIALGLLLMAVTGCGGGDKSDERSPTATSAPSEQPTAAPAAGSAKALAAAYVAGVDGKVEYDYATVNFGQHPKGILTTYNLGGDFRQDWFVPDSFDITTVIIISAKGIYVCNAGPITSCRTHTEESARAVLPIFGPVTEVPEAIAAGVGALETTDLPDEAITGVTAKCFHVQGAERIGVGPPGPEDTKICFSEDGLLLFIKRTVILNDPALPAAELSLQATSVGDAVESDFEPLAPPSD